MYLVPAQAADTPRHCMQPVVVHEDIPSLLTPVCACPCDCWYQDVDLVLPNEEQMAFSMKLFDLNQVGAKCDVCCCWCDICSRARDVV